MIERRLKSSGENQRDSLLTFTLLRSALLRAVREREAAEEQEAVAALEREEAEEAKRTADKVE